MEQLKKWINENLFTSTRMNARRTEQGGKWILKHFPEKHKEIVENTSFLNNDVVFSERIYCILNDIDKLLLCKSCNTPVTFQKFSKGYSEYCSKKCALSSKETLEKKKSTRLKNYGDENYNNRKKAKETTLKNHGVEHHWMKEEVREKRKETWLKKYGYDNPSKSDYIEQKKKETTLKKYGVEKPSQCEEVLNRMKKTCIERYGVENCFQSELFKKIAKQTKLERYGDENFTNSKQSLKRVRKTFKEDILPRVINNITENTNHELIENNVVDCHDKLFLKCENGHEFSRRIYAFSYNLLCPYCNIGTSKPENEIAELLENFSFKFERNNRSFIKPKELDFYLPEYNIAIEFNGIYWHSEESGKSIKYHLNKSKLCENKGIQLLHIFENEWLFKRDIVKSVILSKLGIFEQKYFARKCYIKEIDNETKDIFLEENHLQGSDKSSIKLGLFYNDELLSVMTFGKRKITGGESKFELIRFCNKLNIQIIGGASKLFKYFIRNYDFNEIVTYADRRYSNGDFYEKIGFNLSHVSKPNYWYFKLPDIELKHRIQYQKHKLNNKLTVFDVDLTEYENMLMNGYNRIWDCGNFVYTFNNK